MEEGVSLADRMAFACKYLSQTKLSEYVMLQIQKSVDKGDLNGLLLTGESQEGINILQAHMDSTGDIQTVALIAINYFHRELFNDNRVQYWITRSTTLLYNFVLEKLFKIFPTIFSATWTALTRGDFGKNELN